MAGVHNQRHRLGVVPGLPESSTATFPHLPTRDSLTSPLDSNNKQLIPLGDASKQMAAWHGGTSEFRSSGRGEGFSSSQVQNVVNRISIIEEANKALLEEVYRLQTSIRAAEIDNKGHVSTEKKMQHELMQTMKASNDIISELTSRMRRAEEKLHIDKESRKNIIAQNKQFEQAILSTQQDFNTQRDTHKTQCGELRHRLDEVVRKYDRSEKTATALVDEFRQIKTKLEMQSMDFSHLQTELRQRSKRLEEDTKQAMLETRFQKENTSQAEQNSLQTRQFFEVRLSELRDVITDLRNRIGRVESDAHSQSQQTSVRMSELSSSINEQSHKRQEDIQALSRKRQEQEHQDESERLRLQTKIKEAVDEMSDKLLSKEVRLREEALQKFVEVERQVQKEESVRVTFEKQLREDNETRWNLQQKVLQDELQAIKEGRRNERTKQEANTKRIDDTIHSLEKKFQRERKALEKVLLAEITKREAQSSSTVSQIDAVQEQLRVALSSLQQAIGGVQFQVSRDREQFASDIKTKISEEHARVSRAITDADARLTALSARITQQDETYELKISEVSSSMLDKHTNLLHEINDWKDEMNKDIANMQDVLKDLPQELRETQERVDRLKQETDTHAEVELEARRVDADAVGSKIRMLAQRAETAEVIANDDHTRLDDLQQQLAITQGTLNQVSRTITEVRNSQNVRLNSETKMRLEETSAIKKDLARLRMDVQPFLWKQSAASRRFVKKGMSTLNEWGLYQCARWYDIKMRWMRMLDLGRRRRRRYAQEPSPPPSDVGEESPEHMPTPSAGNTPLHPTGREAWNSREGSVIDSEDAAHPSPGLANEDPSLRDRDVELDMGGQTPQGQGDQDENGSEAWYNKDTISMDFNEDEAEQTPPPSSPAARQSKPSSQVGSVQPSPGGNTPRVTPTARNTPKPGGSRRPSKEISNAGSRQSLQRANSKRTSPAAQRSNRNSPAAAPQRSPAPPGNTSRQSRGSAAGSGQGSAARKPDQAEAAGNDSQGERA